MWVVEVKMETLVKLPERDLIEHQWHQLQRQSDRQSEVCWLAKPDLGVEEDGPAGCCGHVWWTLLTFPVCQIQKETVALPVCLVSLDFNHSKTKQESLAEQAVWHRQKRLSKTFPEHNPRTQLGWTQVPHKYGFDPKGNERAFSTVWDFLPRITVTIKGKKQNKGKTNKLPCFLCWIHSFGTFHITTQQCSSKHRYLCRGNGSFC